MKNGYLNSKLPEKVCPICGIEIGHSKLFGYGGNGEYHCHNCGYFTITYMAYRLTPIINDQVAKQKISYHIRYNSDSENPLTLTKDNVQTLINNVELPSLSDQIKNLLKWFVKESENSLDTVDGTVNHLIAYVGCKNEEQVIQILDEIWKLGYIVMENPTTGPLREKPIFNIFAGHLTPLGIEHNFSTKPIIQQSFPEIEQNSIEDILNNNESATFEVKGSVQLDLNRLLKGDENNKTNKQIAKDGVLKTIVALLNSSSGTILIGVLENDKYTIVEIEKISYIEIKNYYIVGIEIEIENLDKYELTLRDLIAEHISKNVVGLLEITFPKFENFTICKISVSQTVDKWYYLNDENFYVRDGNRTVCLKGNDADDYRRRNSR
ncbi:MAG: ATP-binding protein [Melioribacteraceae bacterium]|nr:ATP-binding protein [Melioribacteraceae bacterium]